MFEPLGYVDCGFQDDPAEVDMDALLARNPWARRYFEDDPGWTPDLAWRAELDALPPPPPDRVILEPDRPLYDRDPRHVHRR